jgi:hypothetical protein
MWGAIFQLPAIGRHRGVHVARSNFSAPSDGKPARLVKSRTQKVRSINMTGEFPADFARTRCRELH